MVSRKKIEPFCGDTYNSLAKIDKDFHWSKEYGRYLGLPVEKKCSNCLWIIELAKSSYRLKVFNVLELVLWCSKWLDATKRIIHVHETSLDPRSLRPIVFQNMLRLPKPNKELKLSEIDSFIAKNGGLKKLLLYFIDALSGIKSNAYKFYTNLLKEPYQEFAWLFAWVMGQGTTSYFPHYVFSVLCCTFRMDLNFNWAQIISNEISDQLENYQQTENFFMTAYFVYVVICNCILQQLPVRKDIDISQEPM